MDQKCLTKNKIKHQISLEKVFQSTKLYFLLTYNLLNKWKKKNLLNKNVLIKWFPKTQPKTNRQTKPCC